MRAIYLKGLEVSDEDSFWIESESHHHLSRVVRLKIGEEFLCLVGEGKVYRCEAIEFKRSKTHALKKSEYQLKDKRNITLFLAPPKKQAFEELLKTSCEAGVKEIVVFPSQYSQEFSSESSRFEKIIQASMVQSNNPFELKVKILNRFEDALILMEKIQNCYYLSPYHQDEYHISQNSKEVGLIIGPEGGFSAEEESCFGQSHVKAIQLGQFILRTPTAVALGLGWCAAHFHQRN